MNKFTAGKSLGSAALAWAIFAGALAVRAQDTPATQPAVSPTTRPTSPRLEQPYSKLSDLTEEQRAKIHEIHKKTLAAERELRDKEAEEILTFLTDPQKVELEKIQEDRRQKMADRAAQRKSDDAGAPTTRQ